MTALEGGDEAAARAVEDGCRLAEEIGFHMGLTAGATARARLAAEHRPWAESAPVIRAALEQARGRAPLAVEQLSAVECLAGALARVEPAEAFRLAAHAVRVRAVIGLPRLPVNARWLERIDPSLAAAVPLDANESTAGRALVYA
jgi:hypothetical protein